MTCMRVSVLVEAAAHDYVDQDAHPTRNQHHLHKVDLLKGLIQWEVKKMKALGDCTTFYRLDEWVQWSLALILMRSDRCCPRIESLV